MTRKKLSCQAARVFGMGRFFLVLTVVSLTFLMAIYFHIVRAEQEVHVQFF